MNFFEDLQYQTLSGTGFLPNSCGKNSRKILFRITSIMLSDC
jgi:hypothetical protein